MLYNYVELRKSCTSAIKDSKRGHFENETIPSLSYSL